MLAPPRGALFFLIITYGTLYRFYTHWIRPSHTFFPFSPQNPLLYFKPSSLQKSKGVASLRIWPTSVTRVLFKVLPDRRLKYRMPSISRTQELAKPARVLTHASSYLAMRYWRRFSSATAELLKKIAECGIRTPDLLVAEPRGWRFDHGNPLALTYFCLKGCISMEWIFKLHIPTFNCVLGPVLSKLHLWITNFLVNRIFIALWIYKQKFL